MNMALKKLKITTSSGIYKAICHNGSYVLLSGKKK